MDYCVALGADPAYLAGETRHFDGTDYVPAAYPQTKAELIEFADTMGG